MQLYHINPILLTAAVIPAVYLLIRVYQADRVEKEPPLLLASLLFLGILSTSGALLAERFGTWVLSLFFTQETLLYRLLLYFIVVGGSEEGAKYLLLKLRTWRSPAFNFQFDGIVYAVFVSMGFALWENIGYVMHYGLGTALIRALTAVPGHACFGVFMGVWYGCAGKYERYGRQASSAVCRKLAFIVPALLHGCYDFTASMPGYRHFTIFLLFVVLLFTVSLRLVRKIARNDWYEGSF